MTHSAYRYPNPKLTPRCEACFGDGVISCAVCDPADPDEECLTCAGKGWFYCAECEGYDG